MFQGIDTQLNDRPVKGIHPQQTSVLTHNKQNGKFLSKVDAWTLGPSVYQPVTPYHTDQPYALTFI